MSPIRTAETLTYRRQKRGTTIDTNRLDPREFKVGHASLLALERSLKGTTCAQVEHTMFQRTQSTKLRKCPGTRGTGFLFRESEELYCSPLLEVTLYHSKCARQVLETFTWSSG